MCALLLAPLGSTRTKGAGGHDRWREGAGGSDKSPEMRAPPFIDFGEARSINTRSDEYCEEGVRKQMFLKSRLAFNKNHGIFLPLGSWDLPNLVCTLFCGYTSRGKFKAFSFWFLEKINLCTLLYRRGWLKMQYWGLKLSQHCSVIRELFFSVVFACIWDNMTHSLTRRHCKAPISSHEFGPQTLVTVENLMSF